MTDHWFDCYTQYCVRCGASRADVAAHRLDCTDAKNVVAISHLRARASLDALFKKIVPGWTY